MGSVIYYIPPLLLSFFYNDLKSHIPTGCVYATMGFVLLFLFYVLKLFAYISSTKVTK